MPWDASDYALLAGALGALNADVESTKSALKQGYKETNPITNALGLTTDQAGLLYGLGTTGIAAATSDKKKRDAFLATVLGAESAVANQNASGGKRKSYVEGVATPAAVGAALGTLTYFLNDKDNTGGVTPYASGDLKHPTVGVQYSKRFASGGFVGGFRPRTKPKRIAR